MAMNPQNSKTQRWQEWRTDPLDGKSYNYNELKGFYMTTSGWSEDHVRHYWYNFCVPVADKRGMGKMASTNSQNSRGTNSMKNKASGAMNQAASGTSEKTGKGKKGGDAAKAEVKKADAKKAPAPTASAEASEEVAPTASNKKKKNRNSKKNKNKEEEAASGEKKQEAPKADEGKATSAEAAPAPPAIINGVPQSQSGCFQGCIAGFKKLLGRA